MDLNISFLSIIICWRFESTINMFGVRCYIWGSISGTCFWKGDQHISDCKRSFSGGGWKILFTRCGACFYSTFFATSIYNDICVSTIMYLSILCEYIWIRFRFILFFWCWEKLLLILFGFYECGYPNPYRWLPLKVCHLEREV